MIEPVNIVQGGQFGLLSGALGPRDLINSVLYSPITDAASAFVVSVPDGAHRGLSPSGGQPFGDGD